MTTAFATRDAALEKLTHRLVEGEGLRGLGDSFGIEMVDAAVELLRACAADAHALNPSLFTTDTLNASMSVAHELIRGASSSPPGSPFLGLARGLIAHRVDVLAAPLDACKRAAQLNAAIESNLVGAQLDDAAATSPPTRQRRASI